MTLQDKVSLRRIMLMRIQTVWRGDIIVPMSGECKRTRVERPSFVPVLRRLIPKLSTHAGIATIRATRTMSAHATISRSFSPAQHWLRLGQHALKNGQRDEAIRALRQAVVADPYHTEALLWLSG